MSEVPLYSQLDYIGQLPTCGPGFLPPSIAFALATFPWILGSYGRPMPRSIGQS